MTIMDEARQRIRGEQAAARRNGDGHIAGRGDSWEGQADHAAAAAVAPGYRFQGRTLAQLAETVQRPEWLVQRMLVRGQPAILGGPKKALKTSIGIDLAVSLATATPFLGRFAVYKRHRVAFVSGESGDWTITETARRVCAARDIDPDLIDPLLFDFTLPQLGRAVDLIALGDGIRASKIETLLLDPLYLALLTGTDLSASNLYDVGPLMLGITRRCLDAGATPILLHHARKGLTASEPMELEDLSFAGVAEFARQWVLLNRRERFDPDTGIHRLWLSAGGSCGQSGLWAVDIDEGRLGDDFHGRKWEVTVSTAGDRREEERQERAQVKRDKRREREDADEREMLAALDYLDPIGKGTGERKVRTQAGMSHEKSDRVIARLVKAEVIAPSPAACTS